MNILRYKQKAQGWMPREDGEGNDATAWGGRESGFDPSANVKPEYKGNFEGSGWSGDTTGITLAPGVEGSGVAPTISAPEQFSRLPELSSMFKVQTQFPGVTNSLNQMVNGPIGSEYSNPTDQGQIRTDALNTYGTETPSTWQKLGLLPGVTSAQFFNKETPLQRDERMGMLSEGAGQVGKAFLGSMVPAPIRMAMGAYGAYNRYQNDPNKDFGKAIATGLSGVPGYAGALANMYNGNYGAAVSGGLAKSGITGNLNSMASVGADYASGKNVAPSLGGLAGQFTGNALGGPVGGMFGKSLGQQMGRSGSIRK